jgi:predicted transcriptional regulator
VLIIFQIQIDNMATVTSVALNANSESGVSSPERTAFREAEENQRAEHLADLLKIMTNEQSLRIFNTILLEGHLKTEVLRTRLKLSRKEYYSRITRLTRAGLVRREKGRYYVTSFGKVIHEAQKIIEGGLKNYWILKAIDSLGAADADKIMPEEERTKIIDLVMGDQRIKEILLSSNFR